MDFETLPEFYRRIGAALWHIQYLEDVLVSFLAMRIIHERRRAGHALTMVDAQAMVRDKRKLTLGPLIAACNSQGIIRPEYQERFETFRVERHWLVHRSLIESGDDLYRRTTRDAVFDRVAAIQEGAISLKKIVAEDCQSGAAAHGVDLIVAEKQADKAIRKVRGV